MDYRKSVQEMEADSRNIGIIDIREEKDYLADTIPGPPLSNSNFELQLLTPDP